MAISLDKLRAYAVSRSLFEPAELLAAIKRLGFVQMDPIRAPARAQDLILRHRVVDYRAGDLERAYARRPLAEDMLHVYGVLPRAAQKLLHPREDARSWRVEREQPHLTESVLDYIRRYGAAHPRQLQQVIGKTSVVNGWGGSSAATTRMLEALHYKGFLRVQRRDSGVKVYALAGAITPALDWGERQAGLVKLMVRLYAPLPESSLRRILAMLGPLSARQRPWIEIIQSLREQNWLREASVDGVNYLWPRGERSGIEAPETVRLLAPFDPLVWDRRRFQHFWGWEYRFEAYTPPDKRRLGYYALPLLWRDAVIGWGTVQVNSGKVKVALGFVAGRPKDPAFKRELDAELDRLKSFLDRPL
jgi:uncharacterized protein